MSSGTADLRAKEATQVDVSLAERLIALIFGLVLSLSYAWDYYDTGFASDHAPSYSLILRSVGGLTESLLLWLQHDALVVSLLAVGTFLVVRRPGYILDDQARRPQRS